MNRNPNLGPDDTAKQARSNVVAFPTKLERNIAALWRVEAQLRARAARFKTLEELQEIYALRQRIIPWLLKYPQHNPDTDPALAPMSDADITKMLLEHPDLKWREVGRTGKWRRLPADDVTRRDDSKKRVKIVMGTGIAMRPISWAWKNWLAHGKLHIFAGRPGCLKTTTAIGFAAGATVGGYWPDGTRMSQGNVVVWSGEDAIEDTLMPRFIAAGGDPNSIAFIKGVEEDGKKRAFDPASDIEALTETCDQLGNVNLIIIDPVVMIAKGDSHKNAETRRDLQPLADLAERTQAALIGIHHLTKRSEGANPVDRVSGSLAFGAAPRVILMNTLDPKSGRNRAAC
jgi:AAA domain